MFCVVQSLKYFIQTGIPDQKRNQSERIGKNIICNKLVLVKGAGARSILDTCRTTFSEEISVWEARRECQIMIQETRKEETII